MFNMLRSLKKIASLTGTDIFQTQIWFGENIND